MNNATDCLLVLTTCPGRDSAGEIARVLITEKLAACVNVISHVNSFFNWSGKLDTADEQILLIKTVRDVYNRLEARIKVLHPYELPEIIAVPVLTGSTEYLDWIAANTDSL